MFFNVKDMEQIHAQKQFIDTVIVPLLSLEFADERSKQSSSAAEFLMSLTAFIEQQFKGRLLVTPPFSYIESLKETVSPEAIAAELQSAGFKHIFFVTCDHHWTTMSDSLQVVWLPAIPLESMDKAVKQRILEDQLKQVIPTFTKVWTS
ncbi:YpiF family protein [Lysinibacillus sp. KU-BSD001]|uniref:YpiF family protein n=1 Tax=Lysinibacillus sp. KU-BSD001 TaxID=3141328 RepID=UPI0036E1243B